MFKEVKVEEIENEEKSRNERRQNDKAHLEIITWSSRTQKYNRHEEVNDLNSSLKTNEERISALKDKGRKYSHSVLKDNEIKIYVINTAMRNSKKTRRNLEKDKGI